jgi:hypothetical protein
MQTGHLVCPVTFRIALYKHHQITERAGGGTDFFTHKSGTRNWLIYYFQLDTQISCSFTQITCGCIRRSLAESDDTRGCIRTLYVVDLLMMSGMRSKHVEESNLM